MFDVLFDDLYENNFCLEKRSPEDFFTKSKKVDRLLFKCKETQII